ncbi:PREDICTED: disease resistance protein At4g27190 [Camelina sativa]|uniref:Disease resistance protein At4g27190 n=1 Tax=Camelina sativa TaxID=90675 RepID=A0ABM0URP1_CAMSA|nr:PREDICTED: disease resistance protein At4g27190 [Camelina sativa]
MECLSPIIGEILSSMYNSRYSRFANAFKFKSNVKALNDSLERLKELKGNMNEDHETLLTKDKPLRLKLLRWQREVEDVISKARLKLEERVSCGCGMSLRSRLSRKLVKILNEVKMLEKDGREFVDMLSVDSTPERVEHVPGVTIVHQTMASNILVKIRDGLISDKAQKIGVWGMGGVGKTTLVRTLNNKLREEAAAQPFGLVIFVIVSKEFDLRGVQKQIAERLDIDTHVEESDEKLAKRIYVGLKRERNFLLILDDVWKPIDLDLLGIPRTEENRGSKIILTSRFLEVCRSMKTDLDVRVDCLREEDAWELFCKNAGEVVRSDHVRPIAKAVSLECGGLPLAIITVGTAMGGKKNVKLWNHVLTKLSKSVPWIKSIEEKIFQPLKLSYDFLDGKAKSCFLLCALFPEDYSIEVTELVMYWMAEGFMEEQGSHEDSMNEGITVVESLKDYCLLEDGARRDTVKMHDVVRDFAIWIMSSSQDDCHSLVMSGTGLQEIIQDKFAPSLRRVSLMYNKLEMLPNLTEEYCVQASALLLQGNYVLKEVPIGFLQAFPNLRILNLSGTRMKSFPCCSLLHLSSLHSLFFRECFNLVELPSLETLAKLELLDLCGTHITEFPRGLEELKSFRHLNLSRTLHLESIPARVVSRLSSLETLDMTSSHYRWSVLGETQKGQATLEEIGCLQRLQVLSIRVHSSPFLLNKRNTWIKRLKKYQLVVGSRYILRTRHDKRRLTISHLNVSQVSIGWLLASTTSLALNHCQGIEAMIKKLVVDNKSLKNLKSLTIESVIINTNSWVEMVTTKASKRSSENLDLLPNLEELHLRRVDLESFSELQTHLGLRLETLKIIEITMCRKLRTLLGKGNFLTIPNLEEIEISYCDSLQNLHEAFLYHEPFLPNLRVLKLRNLPNLVSICNWGEAWECLEQVEVIHCNKLDCLPINSTCGRIKKIKGELSWWERLEWEDPAALINAEPFFNPVKEVPLLVLS